MDSSTSTSARLAEALRLHQSRQFEAARSLYTSVLADEPAHPQATHLLGLCESQAGKPAQGLPLLQRAIALKSDEPAFHNSLGLALKALNRPDEAASALERAIALDGDFPEFHNNLASVRLMQKRLEDAERALTRALALRPNHASAHNNLGMLRLAQSRPDDAIACFQEATRLSPGLAGAWRNLGAMWRARHEFRKAASAFEMALTAEPDDIRRYIELADVLLHLGQRGVAIDLMHKALERDPNSAETSFFLAALGEGEAPTAAPAEYISRLFDGYAGDFDAHLRGTLGYRVPELIADALRRCLVLPEKCAALDAGCGTGLLAPLLRPPVLCLDGVDLSSEMVRHAERTGLYDELLVGDLVSTMIARPDRYDLIVAADVLSYFGDMNAPLRAASRALKRHGHFVFTVEALDPAGGASYRLCDSRRYQHSLQYLRAVAAAGGLKSILEEPVELRKEQNHDVHGFLLILTPS